MRLAVILEVMSKEDRKELDAFKNKVKSLQLRIDGCLIKYQTVYGDTLTFDTKQQKNPTVNGKPVDYEPANVHHSPYVNSVYDSGVVTIRKDDQELMLDFNKLVKQ